jgi:hypothetical protein
VHLFFSDFEFAKPIVNFIGYVLLRRFFIINPAINIVGLIINAGDCMDAGGRATQEQLPNAFYAALPRNQSSSGRDALMPG